MRRFVRLATAVVLVAPVLVGCNDDGRSLDDAPEVPISRETTTSAGPGTADTSGTAAPLGLTISSPSFADGQPLNPAFTCDGDNVPPPLTIVGAPEATVELALTVVDADADGYVHWVLAGIPRQVTQLESGVVPPEAVTARTDSGVDGWDGPCPPEADGPHRYVFTVHALAESIGLGPGLDGRAAIDLIESSAVLATATITATYDA